MQKRSISLPVVVLIAVVALVLGSFGSATAAGLTTKQVKKIAAKVIKKKAPGLSVASAANAANASNAANLGGVPAATYQDRVGAARLTTGLGLATAAGGTSILQTTVTVPTGVNFISIAADATFFGGNTIESIWWDLNGTCLAVGSATSGFDTRSFTDTSNTSGVGSAALHAVLQVPAGAQTVRLCARTNVATTVFGAGLTVETVANGASGGLSLASRPGTGGPASGPAPDAR